MTVHLPTIKQLQYLVALRQHGHFGRAAEACFVTQSTLSAGLRELETLLGMTLVERTRRVVRFTALGEKIAEKAIRVLRETEELAEMARAELGPYAAAMVIDERSCIRCGICVDWCPTECLTMDHFRLTPPDARESVDLAIVADG